MALDLYRSDHRPERLAKKPAERHSGKQGDRLQPGEHTGLKRRLITSKPYTVGTELGVMLADILQTYLGLDPQESRIASTLGVQLLHQVNQVVQMSPWDTITAILQTVGKVPYFDGEGRLTSLDKNMNRLPDRILPDYIQVHDYQIPPRNQDYINKVRVIFLDSVLQRVDSPYQQLGTAQVTTGFFSMHEKLPCWWSADHSQRASGTSMRVIKSVNSGLLPVGTERYAQVDEFHGEIDVDISVWVPILASVMLMEYLAAALLPDHVNAGQPVQTDVVSGTGITLPFGMTISWGRIIQAQAMMGIMLIMMSLGAPNMKSGAPLTIMPMCRKKAWPLKTASIIGKRMKNRSAIISWGATTRPTAWRSPN